MKRARIAVDLDGVIYDWQGAYTYLANAHLGARLNTDMQWWTDWSAADRYLNEEQRAWMWSTGVELGLFRYGHILKGAVDGLRLLQEYGDLEIVTHRPRAALHDTMRFITNLPDVFSGVHFLTNEQPKSSVGCDVYIDDAAHVISDVLDAGAQAVVFDQPWNQDADERAVRSFTWSGVPLACNTAIVTGERETA